MLSFIHRPEQKSLQSKWWIAGRNKTTTGIGAKRKLNVEFKSFQMLTNTTRAALERQRALSGEQQIPSRIRKMTSKSRTSNSGRGWTHAFHPAQKRVGAGGLAQPNFLKYLQGAPLKLRLGGGVRLPESSLRWPTQLVRCLGTAQQLPSLFRRRGWSRDRIQWTARLRERPGITSTVRIHPAKAPPKRSLNGAPLKSEFEG
jgi:hypothetical protein